MIKKLLIGTILILSMGTYLHAATVQAYSEDISNNLNLEAVSSLFGESKDLRDFEEKLNDPTLQISNLDLNGDNQVDYLRVVESYEGTLHLILIQAVLNKDTFQDIATIEADKNHNNQEIVQIVGDPYIYGPNYIIEPVYVHRPPIYTYFWAGLISAVIYHKYHSPYYWGYYPPHFHYWRPRPILYYHDHIHHHINPQYLYKRTNMRRSPRARDLHKKIRRNDYATKNPDKSFANRPKPVTKPKPRPVVKPKPRPVVKPKPRPVTKPKPVTLGR